MPIYTLDARQKPLAAGARHLVADGLRGRARFVVGARNGSQPPYLELSPLEPDDQAEYRCRVDYRSRPRENFLIILFVLGEFRHRTVGSPATSGRLLIGPTES